MRLDLLDVFASGSLTGNPLAVVHGASGLGSDSMLRLTRWLGFSETTFLLPPRDPAADYRVRIFYPGGELPFAGHPTLGSARAWLASGGIARTPGRIVQECGIGLVTIRENGERLAFAAPPMQRTGPLADDERAEAIARCGVDPSSVLDAVHCDNGPPWQLLRLRSADEVLAARPAASAAAGACFALAGPHAAGGAVQWELRAFFADERGVLVEDPVTGSLNAGAALHLFDGGLAQGSYVAAQGQCIGAQGRIFVERDESGTVWIGGRCDMVAAQAVLSPIG
jgi:PhzF family phenazine biosynthesis protein